MAFTLGQLLTDSADRSPGRTALRMDDRELTYAELAGRACAIATFLREHGVERGERVAVHLPRGFNCVAAIYGVLLAGAAYVPLSNRISAAGIASIVRDCNVSVLVSEPDRADRLAPVLAEHSFRHTLGLESRSAGAGEFWDHVGELAGRGCDAPSIGIVETDLACVFYTSGSTGAPKGAVHTHRSLLSNVDWLLPHLSLSSEDRVSSVTPYHFDLSWLELFGTIAAAATMVQFPESKLAFPTEVAEVLRQEALTVWSSVPALLVGLVERSDLSAGELASLRFVLFDGEPLAKKYVRALREFAPDATFCNMYGTTETHVVTCYEVPASTLADDDPLPIGGATAHTNLVGVAADGSICGAGAMGELHVRGPNLMACYWNQPERTQSALVDLPALPDLPGPWYRTGDLVQVLDDGGFTLIGRADRRIKVRGNLVDLDEVERVMLTHEQIREAAAFGAGARADDAHVAAVVVLRPEATIAPGDVVAFASLQVPTYAVPNPVVVVDALPKGASGKLDRRALPGLLEDSDGDAPDDAAWALRDLVARVVANDGGEAPGDEEELLASGLLDSMGVMRIVAEIEDRYGFVIPSDQIVENNFQTIAAIARLIAIGSQAAGVAGR